MNELGTLVHMIRSTGLAHIQVYRDGGLIRMISTGHDNLTRGQARELADALVKACNTVERAT